MRDCRGIQNAIHTMVIATFARAKPGSKRYSIALNHNTASVRTISARRYRRESSASGYTVVLGLRRARIETASATTIATYSTTVSATTAFSCGGGPGESA